MLIHSRSCLLRDSELVLSSLLMIELKSINRASFLRSSFGFPKNMYVWPLLPIIVSFRGFAKERMISISSANPAQQITLGYYIFMHSLLWNVGAPWAKGWWMLSAEEATGRATVNDSCNGTINREGASFDSVGKSRDILRALALSSLIGWSQSFNNSVLIARHSVTSCGTWVEARRGLFCGTTMSLKYRFMIQHRDEPYP